MGDVRQSDFRMTAQIAAYTSITAGVWRWEISRLRFASLEMTGREEVSAVRYSLSAIGFRLLAAGYRLSASGFRLSVCLRQSPPRHCVALSPLTSSGAQESTLGWLPETKFADGIKKTIRWYLENKEWWMGR